MAVVWTVQRVLWRHREQISVSNTRVSHAREGVPGGATAVKGCAVKRDLGRVRGASASEKLVLTKLHWFILISVRHQVKAEDNCLIKLIIG